LESFLIVAIRWTRKPFLWRWRVINRFK